MTVTDRHTDGDFALFVLLLLFVPLLQPLAKFSDMPPLVGVIGRMVASATGWEQRHGRWDGS